MTVKYSNGSIKLTWRGGRGGPAFSDLTVRLNRGDRILVIKESGLTGQEFRIPLTDLFGNISLASLEAVMAPIVEAARKREERERYRLELALRKAVKARDGDRCHWCGREGTKTPVGTFTGKDPDNKSWHIDHVHPRSKGGTDALDNLVLSCAKCNLAKSDDEWVLRWDQAIGRAWIEPATEREPSIAEIQAIRAQGYRPSADLRAREVTNGAAREG